MDPTEISVYLSIPRDSGLLRFVCKDSDRNHTTMAAIHTTASDNL